MDQDEIWVKTLQKGDVAAFDALYMHYAPHVEAFAFCLLKNRDDAEDLTHDIFLKVWENRAMLGSVRSFKDYLFKMTKNAIFNIFEHKQVHFRYEQQQQQTLEGIFSEDITSKIVSEDLLMLINIAVEQMPQQRKTVFQLSRYEGLTYQQIAAQLQISPKTVEYHLRTAMAELRKIVQLITLFI